MDPIIDRSISPPGAIASSTRAPSLEPAPVAAGDGLRVWAMGVLVTLKALAEDTGGGYSLFEDEVPPGAGPPPHVHSREDETWYMLDGELDWVVGGRTFPARTGAFLHLPRGVPHSFSNRSGRPARMVLTYAPAGFEAWFLEVGKPVADPSIPAPVTPDEIRAAVEAAERYGVSFVKP